MSVRAESPVGALEVVMVWFGSAWSWRCMGIVGAVVMAVSACGDDKRRPNGDNCGDDGQCESGLCMESVCLDPEGDEDGDGLVNRVEKALGTFATRADSDFDGKDDRREVGDDHTRPLDFDGDGKIDAVESAVSDSDGDCLVDERDPANDEPDGEAVLARYGCCCDGLCDAVGHDTTATCVGETLVCANPQPDRDGDGVADRCDERLFALSADERNAACEGVCADVDARCGEAAPEGCVGACNGLARDEDFWISNYYCLGESCSTESCFGGAATFPEPALCDAACDAIAACGLGESMGLATKDTCRIACAGASQAGGEAATIIACLADLDVGETCSMLDIMPCLPDANVCGTACSRLAPFDERVCPASAPIFGIWKDAATCRESCETLDGYGRVAFLGCAFGHGCSDRGIDCAAIARPSDSYCSGLCTKVREGCGFETWAEEEVCVAICEGFRPHVPWTDADTALACIEKASSQCAGQGMGDLIRPLFECMAQESPLCNNYCADAEVCLANNPPECGALCTQLQLEQPARIEAVASCVEELDGCGGFLECFSIQPAAACAPACAQRMLCDPNAFVSEQACIQACAGEMGVTGRDYAKWACWALDDACEAGCEALAGVPPQAACEAACVGTDACHAHAYGLCEAACTGFKAVYGDAVAPACLPAALGPMCNLSAAFRTCVPAPQ